MKTRCTFNALVSLSLTTVLALALASCGDDVAIQGLVGQDAASTDQDSILTGDATTDQDTAIKPDTAEKDAADITGTDDADVAIGTDVGDDAKTDADVPVTPDAEDVAPDVAQDVTAADDTTVTPDTTPDNDTAAGTDAAVGEDVPPAEDATATVDTTVGEDAVVGEDTIDAGPVGCVTALDCAGDVTVACQAWQCVEGQCALTAATDGSTCEDGNACTGSDSCLAGVCVGGGNVCDCQVDGDCNDGNVCTDDTCDAQKKCQHAANTLGCDDSNACTEGDVCADSACKSGPAKTCDDANLCTDDQCNIADAACTNTPNTGACQDNNACTVGDVCSGGGCAPGGLITCDDGNLCTDDACDPAQGCVAVANAAPCDDGDLCTLNDICAASKCAGAVNACDDKNVCTVDLCDSKTGTCSHNNIAVDCDDGDACTTGDVCKSGACSPGVAKVCNDGNVCTTDSCDPATANCLTAPAAGACEDGNACTLNDTCADGACAPGTTKTCNDNNVCTDDLCDPATGCTAVNNTASCAPGDTCELGTCSGGSCQTTGQVGCDDANPCTKDTCTPGVGCVFTPITDGTTCSTGTACITASTCQVGVCTKGTTTDCTDGKDCTTDGCDPVNGCFWSANTDPCDDGNACTVGDVCKNGACKSGAAIDPKVTCDDSNPCTDDSCDTIKGCVHANNTTACDDGSKCTTNDVCGAGTCAGTAVNCDDTNVCTNDQCNTADGTCFWTANSAVCDDGDACTVGDACAQTKCVGGAAKSCDDGNVCTTDSCDSKTGACGHANNTASCDDGNPCTVSDTCAAGACTKSSPKSCDDGNTCTTDSCDSGTGNCAYSANTLPCDTGDKCTFGDTCADSACVKGSGVVCVDNNVCTTDACDAATGKCTFAAVADGDPCDDTLACTTNSCQAGKCAVTASTCSVYTDALTCAAAGAGWTLDKPAGKAVIWAVDKTAVIGTAAEQTAHECTLNFNNGTNYCDAQGGGCQAPTGNARTPTIDATAAFGVLTLQFDTWEDVDGTPQDIPTVTLYDATSNAQLQQFQLSTTNANQRLWRKVSVAVPAVSGHKFYIVFNLGTPFGQGNTGKGWYVDNINVAEVTSPEVCNDGLDNDANGATDCADLTCASDPACLAEICNDGIDNNKNDLIDCADSACATSVYCLKPVISWNMDCADKTWAFSAAQGNGVSWGLDAAPATPAPVTGSCTLNFNNGTNYCTAANCGGNQASANGTASLVTAYNAAALTGGLTLQFWSYTDVEDVAGQGANFDLPTLEVTTNNYACQFAQGNLCPQNWNPYTGTTIFNLTKTPQKTWIQQSIDLTAFAGKTFTMRFRFNSVDGNNNNHSGIFIDDVNLFGW